jgi:hypothetical protein
MPSTASATANSNIAFTKYSIAKLHNISGAIGL